MERVVDCGLARLSERTITAPGMFNAELNRVRDRGTALDLEESRAGIVCAATAIHGARDEIAAISVSGWQSRLKLDHAAAAVRAVGLSLTRELGGRRR